MHKQIIYTLFALLIYTNSTLAQEKYEKESRLNYNEVPVAALDFINTLSLNEEVKWYLEEGFDSKSIEAKYNSDKKKYSIEFDTLGKIQDVEIENKQNKVQRELIVVIENQLDKICADYKISKIQFQYTGQESALLAILKNEESKEKFTTKYEVISKCVNNNKAELYEFLLSDSGKLLQTQKIIIKNSSNLEY